MLKSGTEAVGDIAQHPFTAVLQGFFSPAMFHTFCEAFVHPIL
jgi:hypothetical protein